MVKRNRRSDATAFPVLEAAASTVSASHRRVGFGASAAFAAGVAALGVLSSSVPGLGAVARAQTTAAAAQASILPSAVSAQAASQPPVTETPLIVAKAAAPSKYSDPLADIAAVALTVLRGRGPQTVRSNASAVTTTVLPVASASAVQKQVAPPAAGVTGWSATIIDTDQLDEFLAGTPIAMPQAPATQEELKGLPTDGAARYAAALHSVAALVADRITGADADDLEAVWTRTDDRRMTVILTALAQVGTMYRYTGNQPGGFDCSGLTSYSWARAGVKIPRTSTDQITAASPKAAADLLPGDLLWRPGHIGMYLGVGDFMVHSPQTGKPVQVKHWGRITRFGSPV